MALLVNQILPLPGVANIAGLAWWVFWTVASINIVNFMDGVDGMIATQGIVYGVFLFLLLSGSTLGGRFGLILSAACPGFLVWNWSPAKMFMGDVGSGPLGLFFVIGGALALEGAPAALVFLPLFPLFLDALLTTIYAVAATIGTVVGFSVKNASTSRMTAAITLYILLVLIGWKLLHDRFLEPAVSNEPRFAEPKR